MAARSAYDACVLLIQANAVPLDCFAFPTLFNHARNFTLITRVVMVKVLFIGVIHAGHANRTFAVKYDPLIFPSVPNACFNLIFICGVVVVAGDHHYTTDKNEVEACVRDGWKDEGIVFYSEGSVGMTSMYNPYEKHFYHHYTSDECEIACMIEEGWKREAVKWYCIGLDE